MPAPLNQYALTATMRDVANSTTNAVVRVVVPFTGYLKKLTAALGAAKTGDAILTVSRNATALSPTLTLTASGSAANSTFSVDFINQPVTAGDVLVIQSDFGGAEAIDVVIVNLTLTLSK